MQTRLLSESQIRDFIKDVISDEKMRYQKISSLTLEEVNVYIDWIEKMQPYILNAFRGFNKLVPWDQEDIEQNKRYEGNDRRRESETCQEHFPMETMYFRLIQSISPQYKKKIEYIEPVLLELSIAFQQQKRLHEKNAANLEKLNQKVVSKQLEKIIDHFSREHAESKGSLDEDEKPSIQKNKDSETILDIDHHSIKEAQDRVAIQALESLEPVMQSNRELEAKLHTLEQLYESSLAQNKLLQIDVCNLQKQLAEAREQNIQLKTAAEEKITKPLAPLVAEDDKNIVASIPRKELCQILDRYPKKEAFFHFNESTLLKLKRLSQGDKQTFSYSDIVDCIKGDKDSLEIFYHPNNPRFNPSALSKTGKAIYELANFFKNSVPVSYRHSF